MGYATDLIKFLEDTLVDLIDKKICLITNAGGVNPIGCAQAIVELALRKGRPGIRVAVVDGDDLMGKLKDLEKTDSQKLRNMETGQAFSLVSDKVEAANVYLGADTVVAALELKPDIVITGRVTDTGITLAPMIHHFKWRPDDWNLLAAGIIAGHMIECGTQASGGNFTDWHKVKSFDKMGFPIVEMHADGHFIVTKHPGTGGLISCDTVREQLLYEMGDPTLYLTPDVVADFTTIRLEEVGPDRVKVSGIKGRPATPYFKVSMAYLEGFRVQGSILISGPNARQKGEVFSDIFWRRAKDFDLSETGTEYLGWNACAGFLEERPDGNEILLRLGARSDKENELKKLAKNIPALILGGPPGVAVTGGVPKPTEVMSYWPALVDKSSVVASLALVDQHGVSQKTRIAAPKVALETPVSRAEIMVSTKKGEDWPQKEGKGLQEISLSRLCLARSGDKGDSCNIGVIARSEVVYTWMKKELTADRVKWWFRGHAKGLVKRYEVPNLHALNFILEEALGGGGTKTLKIDAQGKTFAQSLLAIKVFVPESLVSSVKL